MEAESARAAFLAFMKGDHDAARHTAKLDLTDSEDSVAEIHDVEHPERVWVPGDDILPVEET